MEESKMETHESEALTLKLPHYFEHEWTMIKEQLNKYLAKEKHLKKDLLILLKEIIKITGQIREEKIELDLLKSFLDA